MKYHTLIISDPYKAEIYENCYARIEIRNDGKRLRIKQDGTRWTGNTGGYKLYTSYIDGRERVKKYWRKVRKLQIAAIKAGDSPNNWSIIDLSYPLF